MVWLFYQKVPFKVSQCYPRPKITKKIKFEKSSKIRYFLLVSNFISKVSCKFKCF